MAKKYTNDNLTVSCLLFGLGHGVVTFIENTAYRDLYGAYRWKTGEDSLEISTSVTVILIYFIIYLSKLKIYDLLNYAYWPYLFNASFWILGHIIKVIVIEINRVRKNRLDDLENF